LDGNIKIGEVKKEKEELEKLIFINSGLMLAFFGIALGHETINKNSIEFLRNNTTDLLKNIIKQQEGVRTNFVNLCYFLEKVSWDKKLHYNNNFMAKFPVKLNDKFLFANLLTSRAFAGITFTSLAISPAIEDRFKKVISSFGHEKFSISFALDSIYQTVNELDEKISHYYRDTPKNISDFFNIFIRSNEKNLIFCLKNFCSGFHYQGPEKKFAEIILAKVGATPALKNMFADFMEGNFKAFNSTVDEGDDEWTNKLFLISIKTLAVLDEIRKAHDSRWIISVALHELRQWIVEIHEVLNKYYIEDDWEKIKDYAVQENEKIEWKSSFYTPLNQEYKDAESDSVIKKIMFEKILKVILAMLNTEGGALIVGVIENPGDIRRSEVRDFLLTKNGLTFFDISYELKKENKTLDHLRLQIIENLKQITDNTSDKFNGLIEFEPIKIRNEHKVITIIKIQITKAQKLFLNVKKEGNVKKDGSGGDRVWVSLTRRAQGQNVDVDVREYI
jgi:hypothetical protein